MKTYRLGQCDLCKWICLGSCCQIDSSEWIAWSSCQADSSKGVSSSACSLAAAQAPCALWANDPSCLHYFFGGFGKPFSLNRLLARVSLSTHAMTRRNWQGAQYLVIIRRVVFCQLSLVAPLLGCRFQVISGPFGHVEGQAYTLSYCRYLQRRCH